MARTRPGDEPAVAPDAVALGGRFRTIREGAGASVERAEADLRIKAKYIEAMEAGDAQALPSRVFGEGFVRNYATWLGLDPGESVKAFYGAAPAKPSRKAAPVAARREDPLAALPSDGGIPGLPRKRRSPFGSGARIAAQIGLVVGVGYALYAGYGLAKESGFIAAAEAPALDAPPTRVEVVGEEAIAPEARPATLAYAEPGAVPYWRAAPPEIEPLEGPVSEISPENAGVLPAEDETPAPAPQGRWTARAAAPAGPVDAGRIAEEARRALAETFGLGAPEAEPEVVEAPAPSAPAPQPFALHATADTWVQVSDPLGNVAFTGILSPGESLPIRGDEGLVLKTGNAGGLLVEIDGRRFGPLGSDGAVMRDVPLTPGAIQASFTLAQQANLTQ